jgi:protein TonB
VPRELFDDVTNPTVRVGSRKWYTVPLSMFVHTVLFAAIIIIPLMATDVLPTPPAMMAFVASAPPPPPPPPPPPAPAAPQPKAPPVEVNPAAAPVEAPREIKPEILVPSTGVEGVVGGVEGGVPGGVVGGVVGGLPSAPPPPPPPPAPVRVGGSIKQPVKIKNVDPIYPPIAQSARVQGVVIIEATIGPDGRVTNAKVLRGQPLLDQAALDAVKQWVFSPTLLNNVPVPVIMTVTVNFTLQ